MQMLAAICIPTSKKSGSDDKVAKVATGVSEKSEDSWKLYSTSF